MLSLSSEGIEKEPKKWRKEKRGKIANFLGEKKAQENECLMIYYSFQ